MVIALEILLLLIISCFEFLGAFRWNKACAVTQLRQPRTLQGWPAVINSYEPKNVRTHSTQAGTQQTGLACCPCECNFKNISVTFASGTD